MKLKLFSENNRSTNEALIKRKFLLAVHESKDQQRPEQIIARIRSVDVLLCILLISGESGSLVFKLMLFGRCEGV